MKALLLICTGAVIGAIVSTTLAYLRDESPYTHSKFLAFWILLGLILLTWTLCVRAEEPLPTVDSEKYAPAPVVEENLPKGQQLIPLGSCYASWYGYKFHRRKTASGKLFDPEALTAAHRTLPFGTKLAVRHEGREVEVTVNDRGPYTKGRCLDLSKAAFQELAETSAGVIKVTLFKIEEGADEFEK